MNSTQKILVTSLITATVALAGALTQIDKLEAALAEKPTVEYVTVTEYVNVPGPIEYVEVPGPVQTIEVPGATVYVDSLPACLYDEVTEVNCFWDAQAQGNGVGRSFIAYNGSAYYAE